MTDTSASAGPLSPQVPPAMHHAGARWWSLDIHAHSPASFDYGGVEGNANTNTKPSFMEWVQAYVDAEVDGIVVTDHNSHDGIEQARHALEELRAENPELRPFVIFPGVEITATGGFHLLAVFSPTSPAEIVNQTLTLCRYAGSRGTSDHTANMTVADIAAEISGLGGICIPAHADQARGVFSMDDRDLAALVDSPHVVAVEVVDDAQVQFARHRGWVPVLGSDAHHLTTDSAPSGQDAKAPGTHLTLIKAERLDLDGLRLALTDAEESVRRCRRGFDDPNVVDHGYIQSVQVIRNTHAKSYEFGPWMNCIIGGRGVGKSTIIEVLRTALGRDDELEGSVAEDLMRFNPRAEAGQRWWDANTRIIVEYRKDQQLLRVTWSGAEPEIASLHLWTDDHWQEQSGRAIDRAPARIFSQKQIYELASSPQSFLAIIDDMPVIQKKEWQEKYRELVLRFKAERNRLRQLLADEERADRLRGQLEEVQNRLRYIAELRASDEFRRLEEVEGKTRAAQAAELEAISLEQRLASDAAALRRLTTENLRVPEFDARAETFTAAADLLDEASRTLASGRERWAEGGATSDWDRQIHDLTIWLSDQEASARVSADQTRADRQREQELAAALHELESSEEKRLEQQSVIQNVLTEIVELRSNLFERRRAYTESLGAGNNSPTKVQMHQQGAVETIGEDLRALLNCPESFDSAFSSDGIPAALLQHEPRNPAFPVKVSEFKNALIGLIQEGSTADLAQTFTVDRRFYARLDNADKFDLITDVMMWFPDDLVAVRYRASGGQNFVPVDRGSPGQKTAALLTVILQMGNDPLILDQPEDDLENKLIRYLAVETLKRIKSSRQLIIATHNANIVVTSASENILVLEHGESIPVIEAEGTLQTPNVKDNVCEILEGGAAAIETRYRRLVG